MKRSVHQMLLEPPSGGNRFKLYKEDPDTKEKTDVREIQINYLFSPEENSLFGKFIRQLNVTEKETGNVYSMWDRGSVGVSSTKIELVLLKSSCELDVTEMSKDKISRLFETLYYERKGSTLKLSQNPITKKQASSFSEAVGNAFAEALSDPISKLLRSIFTFGSVKQYMRKSEGRFNLLELEDFDFKRGVPGCFHEYGRGFTELKKDDSDGLATDTED